MIKYTEQFKIQLVNEYLAGTAGFKTVAKRHGVAAPIVRRWVEWFRRHGTAGLSRKGSRYSTDFKLSVLQHMWDNSLSQTQVAALFNVRNPTSIGIWETRYRDGGVDMLARPPRRKPEDMQAPTIKPTTAPDDSHRTREELEAELLYLRAENAYLKKLEALVQAKKLAAAAQKKRK